MSPNVEPIVYFFDDAKVPIAHVSNARADEKFDCAAGEITAAAAIGRILGIGTIHPLPVEAHIGMRVIKAGAATGVTEGIVVDINSGRPDALRIESPDMTTDYMVCARGDSGSLWVDADTLRPVGLHVAGLPADETRVGFAALIEKVLEKLGGLRVVVD